MIADCWWELLPHMSPPPATGPSSHSSLTAAVSTSVSRSRSQELASQRQVIESLQAELAASSEAAVAAHAAATQEAEAAVAAKEEELRKFKLQLVKAKKLRAQDAERYACGCATAAACGYSCACCIEPVRALPAYACLSLPGARGSGQQPRVPNLLARTQPDRRWHDPLPVVFFIAGLRGLRLSATSCWPWQPQHQLLMRCSRLWLHLLLRQLPCRRRSSSWMRCGRRWQLPWTPLPSRRRISEIRLSC